MNTGLANVTLIPAKIKKYTSAGTGVITKVAAYCRVSTEEENQQNSYDAQISYYSDYISSNPDWQLVGIFADEGISGTCTKNRIQFNKMIRMARLGRIDLILCKSISRFARNTVDCLDYVRELKSLGVTVIFEKENINTSSMSSEFAISLYASFAQAESESISRNVTWGIEKSFRAGIVHYKLNQMLGYRKGADKKPCIVEEEAEIVRYIFREYVKGRSPSEIASELTDKAAKRRNGSTKWTRNNVYQILKNEKYVGDAILQKTYTVNCITHERQKNRGHKPMYLVQNCHDPIIDRKTYETVRLEIEKRKLNSKKGEHETGKYITRYCLSRLLICPYCGGFYKRTIWHEKAGRIGVWRCKNRMEGKKCPESVSYHEEVLQKAVISAVNDMIERMEYLSVTSEQSENRLTKQCETTEVSIREIYNGLEELESRRDAILTRISGSEFEKMSNELKRLNRQEREYAEQLEKLMSIKNENMRIILREEAAREILKDLKPLTVFDDVVIGKIITKIEAISKKEIKITFCGGYTVKQAIEK